MNTQTNHLQTFTHLSANKQYVLQQLIDMFQGVPIDLIHNACEACSWNVMMVVDKLINADNNSGEPKQINPSEGSTFTQVLQNPSGAVPKSVPPTNANIPSKQNVQLPDAYSHVYDSINKGHKVLVLMRGAPGCGKSYLAKSVVKNLMPGRDWKDFILSADDFFFDTFGRYRYNVAQLENAHIYCQTRVREKTALGWSPIFIDNTNIHLWEMLPYVQAGVQNGYIIEVMEPVTPWRNSAGKLASKNTHNVPKQKIQRMLDNYEICTVKDLLDHLKNTHYTVELPQLRSFPPPSLSEPEEELVENQKPIEAFNKTEMEIDSGSPLQQLVNLENQNSDEFLDIEPNCENKIEKQLSPPPKSPRNNKNKQLQQDQNLVITSLEASSSECRESFDKEASNFWDVPIPQIDSNNQFYEKEPSRVFPPVPEVWQAYEQEATNFWGVPITAVRNNVEAMSTDQNESCGLLQLLKEGVKSINIPKKEKDDSDEIQSNCNKLVRHRIGCENENQSFVSLRQIYPNKPNEELWDLFVKCNGSIDWAVDILLKDDDLVSQENSMQFEENCDDYHCGCGSPVETPLLATNVSESTTVIKPQRARPSRNRLLSPHILEAKEAVEKSFILSDELYSSHVKKIRSKRNGNEESNTKKTFVDSEVQTDADDDNENASEEGGEGSEILEINLGQDLITQLSNIFKTETPTLGLPEKYKTNVFMPKSLARELYVLWMESLYNQMEEQRQSLLKEDEDFARLLKNPKYENCKKPPENIRELLDMEFAWMVYKNEQEELNKGTVKHPNDLASHLTRMKLCEIFPNIPKDTLLDILAAHDNKFSETVETLKSSIQPVTIDNQVSAEVLIEKARNENEKLNRHEEQEKFFENNNLHHNSSFQKMHSISKQQDSTVIKKSLSPEEAKRLALTEFEDARNYAAHHCQLRAECYQKAKDAIQRGNSGVALYYSHIANLHKKKIDLYNHRAANYIMEVHELTQNNPDFIDLHYLHVVEAMGCLDIFIDRHIAKLRSIFRSFKYVFIITGRGLHSTGGVSTIKTRVKSRLKERNLKWSEVNPGLLKVKIFSASKYAKNL